MAAFESVVLTNMCMVRDAEGRYLMQDRADPNWGGLVFPGGHVELGESFHDSVVREVREETGITIKNPKLCAVKQFTDDDGRRFIVLFYRTNDFSGTLTSSQEGEALWLTEDELRSRRTVPGFYEMLRAFQDDSVNELYYDANDQPNYY